MPKTMRIDPVYLRQNLDAMDRRATLLLQHVRTVRIRGTDPSALELLMEIEKLGQSVGDDARDLRTQLTK